MQLVESTTSRYACASRSSGKERDTETGNDYMFARYYNSATGRFLSPDWSASDDPVPYAKLDNPQTLNLYGYMQNNPLGGVDLDGHDGCTVEGVADCTSAVSNENSTQDASYSENLVDALIGYHDRDAKAKAQQQYGRQPDGSYRADPAKVQKAVDAKKPIGSGQCVDLCRFLSGAANSNSWVAGRHAADLTDADIGTAIATFDSTGHYPSDNDPLGKNSAIFMGRGAQGSIIVVDQWPVGDGPPGTHQPFMHTVINYSPDNNVHPLRSNNADAYYVIRVP
jgi:RHS repeat-associated protein